MSFQAVEDWLRSLGLLHYAQNFYNNGYEDLDTCKVIQASDLDVIGISHERDRSDVLEAVRSLKQNLYFELEVETSPCSIVPKARLEPVILRSKVKEVLQRHRILLSEPPFTNSDGSFGDLSLLAQQLGDELGTFPADVFDALVQLRRRQLPINLYNVLSHRSETCTDFLNLETAQTLRYSRSISQNDPRISKSTTDLTCADGGICGPAHLDSKSKEGRSLFHWFKRNQKTCQSAKCLAGNVSTDGTLRHPTHTVRNKKFSVDKSGDGPRFGYERRSCSPRSHSSESSSSREREGLLDNFKASSGNSLRRDRFDMGCSTGDQLDESVALKYGAGTSNESPISRRSRRSMSLADLDISGSSKFRQRRSIVHYQKADAPRRRSLFNFLRKSMRRKSKGECALPGDALDVSGATSPVSEQDRSSDSGLSFTSANNVTAPGDVSKLSVLRSQQVSRVRKVSARRGSSPAVVAISSDRACSSKTAGEIERHQRASSLRIKSYPKNQEDAAKRRSQTNEVMSLIDASLWDKDGKQFPVQLSEIVSVAGNLRKVCTKQSKSDLRCMDSDVSEPLSTSSPVKVAITGLEDGKSTALDQLGKIESSSAEAGTESLDFSLYAESETEKIKRLQGNKTLSRGPTAPPRRKRFVHSRQWHAESPASDSNPERPGSASALESLNSGMLDNSDNVLCQEPSQTKTVTSFAGRVAPKLEVRDSCAIILKSKPLDELVSMKLRSEGIEIGDELYSTKDGRWRVPAALVRRYADELEQGERDILRCIDSIRLERRQVLGKPVVVMDSDEAEEFPLHPHPSLDEWLVHVGLPMFISPLVSAGVDSVRQLSLLTERHFKQIGVFDQNHVRHLLRVAVGLSRNEK